MLFNHLSGKCQIIIAFVVLIANLTLAEDTIYFNDQNLENAVCNELSIAPPVTTSDILNLVSLHANSLNIYSLTGLEYAINLEELYLNDNELDFANLSTLEHLRVVELNNNHLSDIPSLYDSMNLTTLQLNDNQIQDFGQLNLDWNKLESLRLGNNPLPDSNVPYLNQMPNLKDLDLSGYDFSQGGLPDLFQSLKLEQLRLNNCNLEWLPNFSQEQYQTMRVLEMNGNRLDDLSEIQYLYNLTTLQLSDNQINDLIQLNLIWENVESLRIGNNPAPYPTWIDYWGMWNLKDLDLSGYDLMQEGFPDISNSQKLEQLRLNNCNIEWLPNFSLEQRQAMRVLELNGNRLNDLSEIQNMYNLTTLQLNDNQISDILILVENPGIDLGDEVYLNGNLLSEQAVSEDIPILEARGVNVFYDTYCEESIIGDIDGNCKVDFTDLTLIAANWLTIENMVDDVCVTGITGDLNDDCKVNFSDYIFITADWMKCNIYPTENCVE